MNAVQRRWQGSALDVLLAGHGNTYHRGPWMPVEEVREAVREETACSAQAVSGALLALRNVGLAASCETAEGLFWKASDAAVRMSEVVPQEEPHGDH